MTGVSCRSGRSGTERPARRRHRRHVRRRDGASTSAPRDGALHKASTTPAEPSRGVLDAVDGLRHRPRRGRDCSSTARRSASTPCSNAAARASGIITNEGLRDIFVIGRGNSRRATCTTSRYVPQPPLSSAGGTASASPAGSTTGCEVEPLDEAAVAAAADDWSSSGLTLDRPVLPALLPQPGPRAARRRDHPSAPPARHRVDVDRHRPGVPRVRAHQHDRARRLTSGRSSTLRHPTGGGLPAAGLRRRVPDHAHRRRVR